MEYGNEKYTDEELKQALIQANGQPTKASEILGVDYSGVYRRIRKNPELLEVQKAYRARAFQSVSNMTLTTFLTGVMKAPMIDEEGRIQKDENGKIIYTDTYVDTRTRLSLAPNLMQTFKSDEGIKEEIIVENKNSFDYSKLSDETIRDLLNAENSENNQ